MAPWTPRRVKTFADRIGGAVLVMLLLAAVLTGPVWVVIAFVLVVPLAAVLWEIAWARLSDGGRCEPESGQQPRDSSE